MRQAHNIFRVDTNGAGFYEVTRPVASWARSQAMTNGLLTLFCKHTSASLLIQENADPSVLRDLEATFERLAPQSASLYEHDTEGLDDMPAHIRVALTQTNLSIPLIGGALTLGTWQGIFLFEHRARSHRREIAAILLGE